MCLLFPEQSEPDPNAIYADDMAGTVGMSLDAWKDTMVWNLSLRARVAAVVACYFAIGGATEDLSP